MKNTIMLVCCDIEGTIIYTGVNDQALINNLIYIDSIRQSINVEKTILSFVSTNDRKSIIENYKKFIKLISFCNHEYNTNIKLGPQFSSCHCYNPSNNEIIKTKENKGQQISQLYHQFENNNIKVNEIIIIDDNLFNIPIFLSNEPNFKNKIEKNELALTFISNSKFLIPNNLANNDEIKTYIENCNDFMQQGLKKRLALRK